MVAKINIEVCIIDLDVAVFAIAREPQVSTSMQKVKNSFRGISGKVTTTVWMIFDHKKFPKKKYCCSMIPCRICQEFLKTCQLGLQEKFIYQANVMNF